MNLLTKLILVMSLLLTPITQAGIFSSSNYLISKHPVKTSSPAQQREIVILVHGLMRTSLSMYPLKNYLQKQGYQVYSYSYPSPRYPIQKHGIYLNKYLKKIIIINPGTKIHFVTHSLGGIIAREAISQLNTTEFKSIGRLVMLAPPNQGSQLAKLSKNILPLLTSAIKPLAELSSDKSAYIHKVPIPNIQIGIIAGRYDAKVPPSFAYLKGQNKPVVINATHMFIMNHKATKKLVLSFLHHGSFKEG